MRSSGRGLLVGTRGLLAPVGDEGADFRFGFRPDTVPASQAGDQLRVSGSGLAEVRRAHPRFVEEGLNFVEEGVSMIREHCGIISSQEDRSSICYEGRAKISVIEDIGAMKNEDWRSRLQSILEASGKSAREVSLAAGKGPGYVHSLLKEGKDPTIDNLIAICRVLNVSLSRLIYGYDVSPETEEILSLLEESPTARDGILQILKAKANS